MTFTEQRTIRLSPYYIKTLEQIQEELKLNFSDSIRHLIVEYEQQTRDDKKTALLLKQLSAKIDGITVSTRPHSNNDDPVLSDQLNRIERNIVLIKKAVSIIGGSDPRTKTLIADLMMEDHEKN